MSEIDEILKRKKEEQKRSEIEDGMYPYYVPFGSGAFAERKLDHYTVDKEGERHKHKLYEKELFSSAGIAFVKFKCECGREVVQCLGEIFPPDKWEV
jgi:hypothetical protein